MTSRFRNIWWIPLWLGIVSVLGMVAALMTDGAGDVIGWIALGLPALLGYWIWFWPWRPSG
ncbi:MAG: hypothetical protein ACLFQT_01185 [Thiohalophilus sp.]